MILKQYYLECLAHASYLLADPDTGEAAVVDPQRDVGEYIADAADAGCRIGQVFLTHFHADFVAGHLELRERVGATIYLGARATAEYPFAPLTDGDIVRCGSIRLVVLETPGHSPESISLVVHDGEDAAPHAVLTGDTLFIGDVGRPDLGASLGWSAEQLGAMLYDSLRQKLLPLPDDTLVYPAHGAGSLCGKNLSTDTVSTIGVQRRYNYALQPMSRERFIDVVTADQPDTPAYFTYDAMLNTRERPTLEDELARELRPLGLSELLDLVRAGAQILDARDPIDFAGAHLRGAVNVGLDGAFETWCGTILDNGRSVVLVTDAGRELEAATRLGRIGFDTVAGHLRGGMPQLEGVSTPLGRLDRITAPALAEQLSGAAPPCVLDVRSPAEWRDGHIGGALSLPLAQLSDRTAELPPDRPLVVYCAAGYRSAIAASLLAINNRADVRDLVGGLEAWQSARLPVVVPG